MREAQRYFVELYAAFSSWPEADHWSAVRIDRTHWKVVALQPTEEATGKCSDSKLGFALGPARS